MKFVWPQFRKLASLGVCTAAMSFTFLDAGKARAILSCTFGNLSGCNGTTGDLKIENFTLGGSSSGFQSGDQIFIFRNNTTGFYEILGQYTNLPLDTTQLTGSGSFSFTASALNGYKFNFATVDSQSASNTFVFNTSLSGFTGSPLVSTGGAPAGPITPTTDPLTSTNVVISWAANGDAATNSLLVLDLAGDPPPVPGPLPILGAASAFGISRRLRLRIKARA